jgi:flavin-dependent dehydrogenase
MIDLLVAGGGPVGLVTAINAALAGLEVTIIDPHSGTIDKACGEGLMLYSRRAGRGSILFAGLGPWCSTNDIA